ncbi:hypothetical protein [Streptomyces cavernae]|uniref:hypothetical protein n=1 Tax=Streptomyces cavernae TaxID=2259034 RepID=UPI001EE3D86D|nr:hypothetical protein [Streptomyces cavernae]
MTTQASWKSEMFQAVLNFLPDWLQWTAIALAVLGVLVSWGFKLRRRIAQRRAVNAILPTHGGEGRGADYLGAYAPQQRPEPARQSGQEPRGADFLGAYAPQQRPEPARQSGQEPRGADFLGAYAPQQRPEPARQSGQEPRGADFLGAYAPQPRQESSRS